MLQMIAQLQAEPLYLMSIVKPIFVLVVLGPWAWLVGRLDKDAAYFYLKREQWGMAHLGAGILGFGVMFLVPIFWVGWFLGILILVGEAFGYIAYRNGNVPVEKRWSPKTIMDEIKDKNEREAGEKAKEQAQVRLIDKDETILDVPHGSDPRTEAFELFQNLILFAVPRGSDKLHITVDSTRAVFVAHIDGMNWPQKAPGSQLTMQLIAYLKENAGMDLNEHRRIQKGKMWVEVDGHGKHSLELTTAGSARAIQLIIEIDPEGRLDIPIDQLGLMGPQVEAVKQLTQNMEKVVLLSSPPHQGTTTSLYAFLQSHDPYTSSVMTYEKEVAFEVEGVSHNTFPEGASNEQINAEFGSLLRSDPNVMMVSHLVSTEMAQQVAQYAQDTRFYLPLQAKDTLSALKKWIKAVGDQKLAANSLGAIVSQRLIRKLCPMCRAPYRPDAAAMKKLNMVESNANQLYKATGKVVIKDSQQPCTQCHGMGYRGLVGVYEVMIIDEEARGMIAKGEGERLRNHLRKQHMVYLQEAALAKVVEGICDIKEVTRVMSENQKG